MRYPKIVVTPPGPKAKEIVEKDHALISPSFGRAYPLVIKSGKGCIITDVDGNEFIDLNAGLAVLNVGHSHPKVTAAINKVSTPSALTVSLNILSRALSVIPPFNELKTP